VGSSRIGGTLISPANRRYYGMGGKVYYPAAKYPSKSDPTKGYTVCEVSDGTTSCDCMGGGRTCKHTQDYELTLRADWYLMNPHADLMHVERVGTHDSV